ncbi:response regulator transcription factor [Rhizobium binae]|uniref:DNA-binding CsgD family transcriptional regulator n=1 Tax=Rhizobium binae TaxID=1138190 RepID=A0ABV2ME41_9HYPH|nr:helix-turn-helix transcriptional regulator [Rhizobium binae]NKL48383.1 LuxR family transcriptional regulator [Rhizobium leguminosarum bv. viciae]MBX4929964.1 helix-turn-helix transcriptional regulator [Rhizobium binae]MBX4939768.1 helix-turn-helix transcriptional regulator [Rhizobium binae]MBX4946287.1 helix-turn-helix transcriptional regulator [Rhizobium binae]MBX4952508.1 helix-turn-helix transcriptional regulator [Rhizobium binae]
MTGHIYDMSGQEARIFANIIGALSSGNLNFDVREEVFPDILKLLRADVLASFEWNRRSNSYGNAFIINQDPENVARYHQWFQYRDPMTDKLRGLRRAAHVEEVISRRDLTKTEFYNDFLARDGMQHGVNLFMQANGRELADLRVWRYGSRPDFSDREIDLLTIMAPFVRRALSTAPSVSLDMLTDRERDVALLVARGCSDKDIARVLGIGFATVRTHVGSCLAKLECSNRAEIAAQVSKVSH